MFNGKKYRRDIQSLRGLAVLAVVLFHANESYFPLGYLGVDVFFVISGFVVTPLILRIFSEREIGGGRLLNLKDFYRRRFYRLAPALAVTLFITAISIFLLGPIDQHQRFARQGISTLLLAGNAGAYQYSGDYFSPNPNPLVHTWSLSVEEQIYIFLPLFLMLFIHNLKSLKKTSAVILGIISAISFISFLFPTILQPLYSRAGIASTSLFSFYSPIDRVWQFTLGGLGFIFLDQYQKRLKIISTRIHLVSVILITVIMFSTVDIGSKTGSVFASLLAVTVIVLRSLDVLPEFLIEKLGWLGDRSYSIYLVHMPLLYVAKYSHVMQIGSGDNRTFQASIAVVVSILLGSLSYSKIENRFRDYGKRRTIGLKAISYTLILTFVTPLVFFASMDRGVKNQYWGLDRNIQKPPNAAQLDPKCLRDSKIGPPCIYTTTGATKTVLLIGDSHAGHISQAVVDASKRTEWNAVVWAHGGCHIQFRRSIPKLVSDECIDINKSMKKWVEKNKPHAIIVSQFVRSNSSQSDLKDALATLHSIVPNILLVENNPVFPDGLDFMVGRPLIMSPYKPPKEFEQSMMQFRDKNASNQLASWARSNEISTLSFDSIFCNKGICSRWSNAGWLYLDADHFSVAGAKLTIPMLSNYLRLF